MKRKMVVVVTMLAMMFMMVSSVAAKDKVEICHVLGNGGWLLKSVPVSALKGHLGHGDALYVGDECVWPPEDPGEEELPPTVIIWISYYIPIVQEFFDWGEYCDPRCPEQIILDQGDPSFAPLLEAYP